VTGVWNELLDNIKRRFLKNYKETGGRPGRAETEIRPRWSQTNTSMEGNTSRMLPRRGRWSQYRKYGFVPSRVVDPD
jgi:hypothetical protein